MSILQLRRYQKKDADLDAVAASGVASAWTAYTPTVTASSGTFTTVAGSGRYCIVGKVVFLQITILITTNGTAAGQILATLPATAAAFGTNSFVIPGREATVTKAIHGIITSSATTVAIASYDGTYPGGSGLSLRLSGIYESA